MAIRRDEQGRAVYGVIDATPEKVPPKKDTKKQEPAETPAPAPEKGE